MPSENVYNHDGKCTHSLNCKQQTTEKSKNLVIMLSNSIHVHHICDECILPYIIISTS